MIFSGWLLPDGSPFYQDTTVIEEDLVLTADYEPMEQQLEETLSIDSFTLNDQAADLAILVEAGEGSTGRIWPPESHWWLQTGVIRSPFQSFQTVTVPVP